MIHELHSKLNPDRAEALLRPILKYWIVVLMDCGGTSPKTTSEFVAQEEPELVNAVSAERVLVLCQELHRSEDPARSEWYGVTLHQFNKRYFDGRLGDYRVRVVYDTGFWTSQSRAGDLLSHIDLAGREIILAFTQNASWHQMECELIHQMAHAATGSSTDHGDRWLQEMKRLKDLGAPVSEEDWTGDPTCKTA
jgi:hypothetical protein